MSQEINEDTQAHRDWQYARIRFLTNKYPLDYWNNKSILELGSFNGVIGDYFRDIGANVLSVEGREHNVARINREFPKLRTSIYNLDTRDWKFGRYDIIINFGLFYHLENFHEEHLINCLNNCETLFLETVIYDSYDDELYSRNESGHGQSLSNIGKTPTTNFIENILRDHNAKFIKFSDPELNGGHQKYDWIDKNSKQFNENNRRFWIING